jgi:hypothetical protein
VVGAGLQRVRLAGRACSNIGVICAGRDAL